MLAPTLNSYAPGTNSPQSSAYANSQNANAKLAGLNKIGGYRTRNYRGGAVTVPVLNTLYQPASSAQSAGSSQVQLAKIGGQNGANSAYDSKASPATFPNQVGGSGVKWGCYSGGRRRKTAKKRRRVSTKRRKRTSKRR